MGGRWMLKAIVKLLRRRSTPRFAQTQSPIEDLFYEAAKGKLPGLVCQHQIGRYSVDFALPKHKIAVECDGYEFHSTPDQIKNDRRRQREIERAGWKVIRFTGSQLNRNAGACVDKVRAEMRRWWRRW